MDVQIVADDAPVEYIDPPQTQQQQQAQVQLEQPAAAPLPKIQFHNMDLEVMHSFLYRDQYLCLEDFMADIQKIVYNADNAEILGIADQERGFKAKALWTAAQVHYHDFDPVFRAECARVASREKQRRKEDRKEKEKHEEEERQKEGEYDAFEDEKSHDIACC